MIKAITFDLWDTVFIDDSDEPKRQAAGKPSKAVERRQLVKKFIDKHYPISMDLVTSVYDAIDAAFKKVWYEQHSTWRVQERLELVLKGLGRTLPAAEMKELVRLHEEMELEFRPDFVPGVHEAVKSLHKKYQLAVISDTIFSPGRTLRKILQGGGILECFDVFIFSDEFGCSKPEPALFHAVCEGLGIKSSELVHIGDREHNDILGPQKLGIHSILCTAAIDRGSDNTQAVATFNNYKDLPAIIERLNRKMRGENG
jgi:HAD superfamily hydrolase (TIGR01549 family)